MDNACSSVNFSYRSQVPVAGGSSSGAGCSSCPEAPPESGPAEFVPLTRFSEVQSPEEWVRFLRTRLDEKVKRVKELEGELKACQSREQLANDREQFLLTELAEQVSDLDCKFATFSGCFLAVSFLIFVYRYPRKCR